MRIRIESNFVIPGLRSDELELGDGATVRRVLNEITGITDGSIEFFPRGCDKLDPDDWEVDLNGVPSYACEGQLERSVADGDVITIRIVVTGGG